MFNWLVMFCSDINGKNQERNARLERIEAFIETFENHETWQRGKAYGEGAIVTYDGSGWICKGSDLRTARRR